MTSPEKIKEVLGRAPWINYLWDMCVFLIWLLVCYFGAMIFNNSEGVMILAWLGAVFTLLVSSMYFFMGMHIAYQSNKGYKAIKKALEDGTLVPDFYFPVNKRKCDFCVISLANGGTIALNDQTWPLSSLKRIRTLNNSGRKGTHIEFVFRTGDDPLYTCAMEKQHYRSEYQRLLNFLKENCGWK